MSYFNARGEMNLSKEPLIISRFTDSYIVALLMANGAERAGATVISIVHDVSQERGRWTLFIRVNNINIELIDKSIHLEKEETRFDWKKLFGE